MRYFAVTWKHDSADTPVLIYAEVDEALWERRKVEVYRDGHQGYADGEEEVGDTGLSIEPWPDLKQIATDPEFELSEIGQSDFELIWAHRSMVTVSNLQADR